MYITLIANIFTSSLCGISHRSDCFLSLDVIFSFLPVFAFHSVSLPVCINVYIFCWSRGFRKLFIADFHFDNFICNRQIRHEEQKVGFGAEKAKTAARRPENLQSRNRSNEKDFLMIRAKFNRNGLKTEKVWISHVKR